MSHNFEGLTGSGSIPTLLSLDLRGTGFDKRGLQRTTCLKSLEMDSEWGFRYDLSFHVAEKARWLRRKKLSSLQHLEDSQICSCAGLTDPASEEGFRFPAVERLELDSCSLIDLGLANICTLHACLRTMIPYGCHGRTDAGISLLLPG